jgi:hypothetical protein
MKIQTILDQIDLGSMALPEFQRGYVWNREQVRGLMHSLYHKHPVGSLLVWVTKTESATTRGDGDLPPGTVKLLLDGQQRMTSLYGIIRGTAPKFFEGQAQIVVADISRLLEWLSRNGMTSVTCASWGLQSTAKYKMSAMTSIGASSSICW